MNQQYLLDQQNAYNQIYTQPSAPPLYEPLLYEPPTINPNYSQGSSYTYQSPPSGLTSSIPLGYYFCIISFILCLAITIKMLIKNKNEWGSLIILIISWCIIGGYGTYFIYTSNNTGNYSVASYISCMLLFISCIVSLKKTFNIKII
jgi:hypothetical protein